MPDPYVSVIVTAHDRRRYLPEALHSLEAQTLSKDKFEVIVVKNFEDPISDEIIRRNGWKNVVTDVVPVGSKIAIGLEEARGEVITFLEDDDMYAPERLRIIAGTFQNYGDLTYFHNGCVIINSKGEVIGLCNDLRDMLIRTPPKYCRLLFSNAVSFHNTSSIAESSWILHKMKRYIKKINATPDFALLSFAVLVDGMILLSGKRLTLFRVHGQSTDAHTYRLRAGHWRKSVAQLERAYLAWMYDHALLAQLFSNHPCYDYLKLPELVKRLEVSAAPDGVIDRKISTSPLDFVRAFQLQFKTGSRDIKLTMVLALDSILSKSPGKIRELYWFIRWELGKK